MNDAPDIDSLKREHALLSQRSEDSKREANQVRARLGESQRVLNEAEEALQLAQTSLAEVEERQRQVIIQVEAARQQITRRQEELQHAHQMTANLARELGPIAQKQRRFQDALVLVEQNLRESAGSASLPSQLANKPLIPTPPTLPKPPQFTSSPFDGKRKPLATPIAPGPLAAQPVVSPLSPAASPSHNIPPLPKPRPAESSPLQRPARIGLEAEISFQLEVSEGSSHQFYTGFSNNISEGGIFIVSPSLLEVGTQISFPISLPGMPEPEIVEGVIRWVRRRDNLADPEGGFGVQFTLISDHLKMRINQYIQSHESLFYDA